jgi:nicotinamidase-related amidase
MPGWDDFLTAQDKQLLAVWGKKDRDEFGKRPVLLVVDVYYAAVGHERKPLLESIRDWPMSCGLAGWEAIDRMVGLIAAARANGIPVVYVRGMTDFPSDRTRVVERGGKGNRGVDHLPGEIRALGNEIVAEVAPQPGELVLGKTAPSAFAGTPLLHYLRQIDADTLIVCGESTSGCVRAAVLDAQALRYRIGIVGECCFDRVEASHWMNLFDMHQKYGEVIDVKAAADYFAAVGTRPQEERLRAVSRGVR